MALHQVIRNDIPIIYIYINLDRSSTIINLHPQTNPKQIPSRQISCMLWLHLALIQRWSGADVDASAADAASDAGLTPHGAVEIRLWLGENAMEM